MLTNLSHSIDSGLTHLFLGRTSHPRSYDAHGCTHVFSIGYTAVDASIEIGTTSMTWNNGEHFRLVIPR